MKRALVILSLLFLFSCKSKSALVPQVANTSNTSDNIINKYNQNILDFKTLNIRASIKYHDPKQSHNFAADIRILKDQKILISIKVLGITMAKAYITPTSVQYYSKLQSNFFEGDYSLLSQWIGTDLDFFKVQNLLLSKTIDTISNKNQLDIEDQNNYKITDNTDPNTIKTFFIENQNGLLKKQQIQQVQQKREFQTAYLEHQKTNTFYIPQKFEINALQNNQNTTINVEYKTVTIDEELSFPYTVPEDYEQIYIQK